MADYEQTTKTNPRRPDCVTKIRMGNSVLVVSGYPAAKSVQRMAGERYEQENQGSKTL